MMVVPEGVVISAMWFIYNGPMQRGFSMIEAAIVILIGGIVMAGFLQVLSANTQVRMTQINYQASEAMTTAAIMESIKGRAVTSTCVAGTCSAIFTLLGTCLAATPCPTYTSSYPVPAAASVVAQKDFWGNAMTYTPNAAVPSVSSSTPPATTVFTLRSIGPDTVSGNTDDITYVVTAAEFIARVSRTGL